MRERNVDPRTLLCGSTVTLLARQLLIVTVPARVEDEWSCFLRLTAERSCSIMCLQQLPSCAESSTKDRRHELWPTTPFCRLITSSRISIKGHPLHARSTVTSLEIPPPLSI